jgi:hypothetical protein
VDLLSGAPGSPYASPRLSGPTSSKVFGPYGVASRIRVRAVAGLTTYTAIMPTTSGLNQIAPVVRSLIAAASVSNSVINRPWAKAPDWAPNTAYQQGTVVRGIGAGNTGNLYVCCSTGTSAAGTGPTGRGSTGIFDNTTSWLYIGPAYDDLTLPFWSTVTPASASDVMNGMVAIVAASALAALGITRMYGMTYADPSARVTGGLPVDAGPGFIGIKGVNGGTLAAPTYPVSTSRWCVHFQTDSRKWLFIQPQNVLYPSKLAVEVNGRMLIEGGNAAYASTLSGGGWLLDMSRFPAGAKDVRVYGIGDVRASVFRLHVGDDELIWKPAARSNLVMAFEGDSITQGGGVGPAINTDWVESLVCRQLGIEQWFNNAVGGTGTISDGNGTKTTYLQRLPDLVAMKPDIVLIGGFHNDNMRSQAEQRAAFLTYLQAVRSSLPNATIFLVPTQMLGNESLVDGVNSHYQVELNAKWAFDQLNDANACFIPMLTRSRPFPAVTTDGWFYQDALASPFNDAHPTPRYYRSYAQVVVEAIKDFFASR